MRTAWIYSPFGRNFVKTIRERALDGQPLRVVDDVRGSPTYAIHFAAAVMDVAARIAGSGSVPWGIYHAAGQGAASWYDVARETLNSDEFSHAANKKLAPISTDQYATRAVRPAYSVLDCGKLARVFEITLPPWQRGVADCRYRLSASPLKN